MQSLNRPANPPRRDMQPLVTMQDHLEGFKEIEVTFRGGEVERVRLTAPPRSRSRDLAMDNLAKIAEACLPEEEQYSEANFLDKLVKPSADLVELTAIALVWGWSEEAQKKMAEMGVQIMREKALASEKSKAKSV